ncbi:Pentatricopeptide repeat-containing protein [Acorus gramineus]|uniref:Pentatricopeptide repeat-containing protein n=1 Tax=Acorus gramineus TaxID=55184 RepID=A0AAV9BKL9_ACOGR|nr:Pentatricopeptide repeat-containing protein [Acorus gramineus]
MSFNSNGLLRRLRPRHFIRRPIKENPHFTPSRPPPPPPPKVYMRTIISRISNILRSPTWVSAKDQLDSLTVKWDSYTVNQVLKTHPPMAKAWLFFNWASNLKGFKHDQFTYTTMMDIFGEAGRFGPMRQLFDRMVEKGLKVDAVTYTSLLHWTSREGDADRAVGIWGEMKRKGCSPTVVSYTAYMKVLFDHGRAEEAVNVYKEMMKVGCPPNCYTFTVLIEYLCDSGKFKAALEILDRMQETEIQPDKALCNILVQKCARAGEITIMTRTLQYMREKSIVLRLPIFLEALEFLKLAGESDNLLREVSPHLSSVDLGEEETTDSDLAAADASVQMDRGIIVYLLAKHNFIAVEKILNEMSQRNIQLDSELMIEAIQASCVYHSAWFAISAFKYCIKMEVELSRPAYISLIGLLIRTGSFDKVIEISECIVKTGITLGEYLVSLLIYRLGCAGMPTFSERIFNCFPADQSSITCTALMDAYFRAGEVDKGLEIYQSLGKKGFKAFPGTYEVLITGLEGAGRIQEAKAYRKTKKSLQHCNPLREFVSFQGSLCSLLFDGGRAL